MTQTFPWQRSYQDAMLELDPVELRAKVQLALSELQERSRELLAARDSESSVEWQAIADARSNLSVIQRHELASSPGGERPAGSNPSTTREVA